MRSISRGFIGVLAFAFALGTGYASARAADPTVPGVSFNGGDGSYTRVLADAKGKFFWETPYPNK